MLSRIAALLPLCSHANGFAEGALCADASTTLTNNSSASLNGTMQYLKIIAERFTYHFAVAAWRTNEAECALGMKYWEIIADNLKKAGWSLGYVSAVDCQGRTIWIVEAHRGDGRRFVVRADEKLTAFM